MEEKLGNVEASVDRLDQAVDKLHERFDEGLIEVHERIDEVNDRLLDLTTNFQQRMTETIQDVERTLDVHVAEEEKLFLARFTNIAEKIDANAKLSDERGQHLEKSIRGIRNMNAGFLTVVGVIVVPSVGYLAAKILDNLPHLVLLLDKLENLK